MREYFTIMVKENSKENLGLLTEKLNEGFYINERVLVGKSTILVLTKNNHIHGAVEDNDMPSLQYIGNNLGGY